MTKNALCNLNECHSTENSIRKAIKIITAKIDCLANRKIFPFEHLLSNDERKLIDKAESLMENSSGIDSDPIANLVADYRYHAKNYVNFLREEDIISAEISNGLSQYSENDRQKILQAYKQCYINNNCITKTLLRKQFKKITNYPNHVRDLFFTANSSIREKNFHLYHMKWLYDNCDYSDPIMNLLSDTSGIISDLKDVLLPNSDKTVLFDQNIYSKYFSSEAFRNHVKHLKNKNFVFLYDPYNIEETLKYEDASWQKKRIQQISEITDCLRLVPYSSGTNYSICKEDPSDSVLRVKKYNLVPELAQKQSLHLYKLHKQLKSLFDAIFPIKLCDIIEEKSFEKFDVELTRRINSILYSCSFLYFDPDNNYRFDSADLSVSKLYKFLTLIGYAEDKEKKTIRSAYFDCQHIDYGQAVTYFVSDDLNMRKRCTYIYNMLRIKTEVCSCEEFVKKTNSESKLPC